MKKSESTFTDGQKTKRSVINRPAFVGAILAVIVGFTVIYSLPTNRNIVKANCKVTCVSLMPGKMSPDTLTVRAGAIVQFNFGAFYGIDGQTNTLMKCLRRP